MGLLGFQSRRDQAPSVQGVASLGWKVMGLALELVTNSRSLGHRHRHRHRGSNVIEQATFQSELGGVAVEVLRILEIEAEVRHDVIGLLTNVNEHVGGAGRCIHVGMTSSHVLGIGLALQLKRSVAGQRLACDHFAAGPGWER